MVKGLALYDVKHGGSFSYTQPILLGYLFDFLSAWLCFVNLQLQDWGSYEWPVEGMYSEKMTIMPIISVNLDVCLTSRLSAAFGTLRLYLHNSIHHPHILSYIDMWNCFPCLYNQHYHHSRQCLIHIHQHLKVELQPDSSTNTYLNLKLSPKVCQLPTQTSSISLGKKM